MNEFLFQPIEHLPGIGATKADILKKEVGIFNFYDLLTYFPYKYVDRTKFYNIRDINSELSYIQIKGHIIKIETIGDQRNKRLTAIFKDEQGDTIELVWFKGIKWIQQGLKTNVIYVLFGKPTLFNGKYNIAHPELEILSESNSQGKEFQPFYNTTEKMKQKALDSKNIWKLQKTLLQTVYNHIQEHLPSELCQKLNLLPLKEAFLRIHFPNSAEVLKQAIYRLKFDELFFNQIKLLQQKQIRVENNVGFVFSESGTLLKEFYENYLPFELTNAQKRVIKEIRKDMGSGKQMNRLLQGDVGSGKTVVALMSMLIAIGNGFQAALMAPTEILAQQHFQSIRALLQDMNVKIALLTGSTKQAERKIIHQQLLSGELHAIIGTHALIEDKVQFNNLGLVIIDEQHRFGVEQRAKLWRKNNIPPHVLVMTATPIPRTLAMTLYGDLDISVIDELPPGRQKIITKHLYDSARIKIFAFMKQQIALGRQVYVVYPLIEESETLTYKDLMDGFESISRAFPKPQYQISIVHGKMKPQDKEYEMQRFAKGETNIMVATTVIEVGVNVPNASVMVIESAEKFGLSQLHQLRGRVGRGAEQSYCLLVTDYKLSKEAKIRLKTMVDTTDGFKIAETDLQLRGPGDLQGTKQSGIVDIKLANLSKDADILQRARQEALYILQTDAHLSAPENQGIKTYIANTQKGNWSKIS